MGSETASNGILVSRQILDQAWKNLGLDKSSDVLTKLTQTEFITACLKTCWKEIQATNLKVSDYLYVRTIGDTFSYRNVTVRTKLEEIGGIADLGWFLNACIANVGKVNVRYEKARVVKASEIMTVLKLTSNIYQIATNLGQPGTTQEEGLDG